MFTSFLSRGLNRFRRLTRKIWMRTSLIALLAVVSAVLGAALDEFAPSRVVLSVEVSSVTRLLEILAASMLTVTTFSLSIMVSARQSASSEGTPRSHSLVLEDRTTQTVIATFLGAFVFALASLVLIAVDYYSDRSITVILAFTIVVIGLVVLAILRWIEHLSDLGGISATASKLEAATAAAIRGRTRRPCLGARPLSPSRREIPIEARTVQATRTGHVDYIDVAALDLCARKANGKVFVVAEIGCFVAEGDVLCHYTGSPDPDDLRSAFSVARMRSFDDDPRFGVIAISEIAQRALSPGVNDPGTAIAMIGRLVRLLADYENEARVREDVEFPHVWIVPVTPAALLSDAFAPIARDGAGVVEVQVVLQKALKRLAANGDAEMAAAARHQALRARDLALEALPHEDDRNRIRALAPDPATVAARA